MKTGPAVPDPNAGLTPDSILIPTVGKGPAFYFRDGTVERGTWEQVNEFSPPRFYDRKHREIALNPGQTWIEAVPPGSPWSYR
jgi:hypothetical protein